jgi:adenosylmethionine-8-amino-7-oxononanoate aminotransferase
MTAVFHRDLRQRMPEAVAASGLLITDRDGHEYLDACGGAAVSCLGHNHPDVIAAMREALEQVDYAHTSFFTTRSAEDLAEILLDGAPEGMARIYFAGSGSEAMETALKLARQYFVEIGQPGRSRVIARRQSYHGNSLGALAVSGNAQRRALFAPLLIDVAHVSPCYEYRERRPDETPEAYGRRLAAELETEIVRIGPESVMAFCAETIVGATLGAAPPVPGYFRAIRDVCDRYGVLLILDEVMCGMGRSGAKHAALQEDVAPDIMTIAKGLGGGYQAIGAVMVRRNIVDAFENGSGRFVHGHTYLGHPMACAAALAVQRIIRRDGLVENVARRGEQLATKLHDAFGQHPHVGDIRGRGLFLALEFVADRATREPFPAAFGFHNRLRDEALARGLMVYAIGGTVDGKSGDHVLLAPPFTVTDDELDRIVARLGDALAATLDRLPQTGRIPSHQLSTGERQ